MEVLHVKFSPLAAKYSSEQMELRFSPTKPIEHTTSF